MAKNIILYGMLGTGKSTVGQRLANTLDRELAELDDLIVTRAEKSRTDIFSELGEVGFRELERSVVRDVATQDNLVVSCGGGALMDNQNRLLLEQNGIFILLTASEQTILQRTKDQDSRPIFKGNRAATIRSLLKIRMPAYMEIADCVVATDDTDIDVIVHRIIECVYGQDGQAYPDEER